MRALAVHCSKYVTLAFVSKCGVMKRYPDARGHVLSWLPWSGVQVAAMFRNHHSWSAARQWQISWGGHRPRTGGKVTIVQQNTEMMWWINITEEASCRSHRENIMTEFIGVSTNCHFINWILVFSYNFPVTTTLDLLRVIQLSELIFRFFGTHFTSTKSLWQFGFTVKAASILSVYLCLGK